MRRQSANERENTQKEGPLALLLPFSVADLCAENYIWSRRKQIVDDFPSCNSLIMRT
jgi:hypothetical protein